MKLLTGPLTLRITEVRTRHGVTRDWHQGALPCSNTGPPLFMAQRQLQRGRPNYFFSFDARKALDTSPQGALHLILRHLSVPPEVIDLLLFFHTCARLRIVTAHGLTQPVHMLRGFWQGNPGSPLLYALLPDPLLRAQGQRLCPSGKAERGLIQAYIDNLLVVARTLQHFVEGVEAVAAYLKMMSMELNSGKCAMATKEGVPGLQLRLCPHLENPWHWVPAADSVPYLGLQLQPDGKFSLQRKHQLRLAAVHHWCLNTLATPKVVQDVYLAILGSVTKYVAPFIADYSDTARHLDHITVQVAKDRARYAFDASRDSLQDDRTLGLTRVPTRCQQATVALLGTLVHHHSAFVRAEATRMFWEFVGAHGICPEVHYPGGGRLGPTLFPGPGCSGGGALQPHRMPQGGPRPAAVPPGQRRHAVHRQASAPRHVPPDGATRDTMAQAPRAAPPLLRQRRPMDSSSAGVPQPVRRQTLPVLPSRAGAHRPPEMARRPGPPLPHQRHAGPPPGAHPAHEAKRYAHTGPKVTLDGLHLHVGGYHRQGSLSPPRRGLHTTQRRPSCTFSALYSRTATQAPNADVAWPEPLRPQPHAQTLVWLVTKHDQCARATEQAQLLSEWEIVQPGEGQPSPCGLPRGTTLLVVTEVPQDPHMAVQTLEDQPGDTGHLVLHQRGGLAWLRQHITALRSWASTIAEAEVRLHDHPTIRTDDTRALNVDQFTPGPPDLRSHSADLNVRRLSPTGYYWIPEARGHTSSDASGGGRCRHPTSVALAANLTCTWAVAMSRTVPDREGVAASLPLQYSIHRPLVDTVDAKVVLHLLRHADRKRATGVHPSAAKAAKQMPSRWLQESLRARGQHSEH